MSLFGSFEIGKRALTASQMGQSTTGHNIANVDTEGFSRQELLQSAARPTSDGKGTGVEVDSIRRIHDGFTKQKIVDEQTLVGSWNTREKILTEAEVIYTDLEGARLGGSMNEFWSAWNSVANEPESGTHRKTLLNKAQGLAEDFRMFNKRLDAFNQTLNDRIQAEFLEINEITKEIGLLNKQVEQLERRNLPANDARDRRELLLQKLSEKVEVKWFETPRGTLEIQIPNGQHLVHGRDNFELRPHRVVEGKGNIRIGLLDPADLEVDVTDVIREGGLKEMINQRDGNIRRYQDNLNDMVKELAFRVNQIHSSGTGINGIKTDVTSAYPIDEGALSQPLPFLKTGNVEFKLLSQDGEIEEVITVHVKAGVDTLSDIVEKINRAADAYEVTEEGNEVLKSATKFIASQNEDGTLNLDSGMGKQFIFGNDETNLLTVLGLNCFFHYTDGASDIRVAPELVEDEMKIAAGRDLIPGDNSLALEMAELQLKSTMNDETVSFAEFYNSEITDIGLKVQHSQKGLASHQQMLDQYEVLRDSVSSVNLDEEMTKMIKYQRAYESSAKYLGTIDQMTQTLVNM